MLAWTCPACGEKEMVEDGMGWTCRACGHREPAITTGSEQEGQ